MPESSKLVRTGIVHLENQRWKDAIECFDGAIVLRETDDWKNNDTQAWGLAAAWINRSDALRATGNFPETVLSLRNAIRAMDFVPLADHPAYPERLILSWINLATCLSEKSLASQSLDSFSKAERLLETWGEQHRPNRRFLSAMLQTNRARLNFASGENLASWRDASAAVQVLKTMQHEPEATIPTIQAHGVVCQALAGILEEPDGVDLEDDWIARATDAAEEALFMAKSTVYHGEWLSELIHYCARIYRICQPHFLGEFILETCDPANSFDVASILKHDLLQELAIAKTDLKNRISGQTHDADYMHVQTKILQSLQSAEHLLSDVGKSVISLDHLQL